MLTLILIISFIIYSISLSFFLSGLFKSKIPQEKQTHPHISVILCVRNGQKTISNILTDLMNQDYKGKLDFIIVDDNSDDNTHEKIKDFLILDNRFKYYNTKSYISNLHHKKKALSLGIENSKSEWLLFTDVDCRINKSWVTSISEYYDKYDFIIGFSHVAPSNSIVSRYQSIDFQMLMYAALGSSLHGVPFASSGQNQSYKKSIYNKVNGFSNIKSLFQGDDSIFLQLYKKQKNIRVCFSENVKSHVKSKTHNTWKEFILQRIRWSGDANVMWKYNKIFFLIILSSFFVNALIPLSIIYSCLLNENLFVASLLLFVKFILELSLYYQGCNRLNKTIYFYSFIIWFIIQPIYIIIVGFLSFYSSRFLWQGRAAN